MSYDDTVLQAAQTIAEYELSIASDDPDADNPTLELHHIATNTYHKLLKVILLSHSQKIQFFKNNELDHEKEMHIDSPLTSTSLYTKVMMNYKQEILDQINSILHDISQSNRDQLNAIMVFHNLQIMLTSMILQYPACKFEFVTNKTPATKLDIFLRCDKQRTLITTVRYKAPDSYTFKSTSPMVEFEHTVRTDNADSLYKVIEDTYKPTITSKCQTTQFHFTPIYQNLLKIKMILKLNESFQPKKFDVTMNDKTTKIFYMKDGRADSEEVATLTVISASQWRLVVDGNSYDLRTTVSFVDDRVKASTEVVDFIIKHCSAKIQGLTANTQMNPWSALNRVTDLLVELSNTSCPAPAAMRVG